MMNLAEEGPSGEPIGVQDNLPTKWYPTIHLSKKGEEIDLPDEGEMTVTFRKTRSEESRNDKGEERYSCTLELHEILKVKSKPGCCSEEKEPDEYSKRGEILDKLRDALTKSD